MKLTKLILTNENRNKISIKKLLPSLVASIFSILFSLSIILELSNIVDGVVLVFLSVFTVLFLIMNEKIKVSEIKKLFNGNKSSIMGFVVTFLISISLSTIGVYLWTNKSLNKKNDLSEIVSTKTMDINNKYISKINSLKTKEFEDSKNYITLEKSLTFWKTRSAYNIDDRNNIRNKIKVIEGNILKDREKFNLKNNEIIQNLESLKSTELSKLDNLKNVKLSVINKNDYISVIFIIMIFITEIGIVILNYDVSKLDRLSYKFINSDQAKKYLIGRNVLTTLFLTKSSVGLVTNMNALYSPALLKLNWSDEIKWKETKILYNLLITLKILDTGYIKEIQGKRILHNKMINNKKEAYKLYDCYFEQLMSI